MSEPRALSADELRDRLLDHMRQLAACWSSVKCDCVENRIEGFAFSVLSMLDGESVDLPAFDLVARTHAEDKQFHIENGDNWVEDETRISDWLHENW